MRPEAERAKQSRPVALWPLRARVAPIRSLGVVVGSFDPLHLGHQWMIAEMLQRHDTVALLVPTHHFEKTWRFPENATPMQRLALIARVYGHDPARDRLLVGLTDELLFLQLHAELHRRFPGATIGFGMGSDTYGKLLASRTYFRRLGLGWTRDHEEQLERLRGCTVVFQRQHRPLALGIPAPARVEHVCSTRVRQLASHLHAIDASPDAWSGMLAPLLAAEAIRFIQQQGLYRGYRERLPRDEAPP